MSDLAASGMFLPSQTVGTVLCCICGVPISPNPANMCVRCLRSRVDITEGLPRHASLVYCPECRSYLQPPRTWIRADLESKELLSFCLRRLKPLTRHFRIVNAEFVWTEPHSKRIKLRLRVQREALNGAILEQSHLIEFTQHDNLCESCSRSQANPDQWVAAVQLRQHVSHRRSFFHLEQLILHHGAAARTLRIKEADRGIDFFFGNRSHAIKFVDFISSSVPVQSRCDKQLVSHDTKSNTYNYKHTFSVEICPICREDLICLPPKVANTLGNIGPLVLCTKVSSSITLLNPFTLRTVFLDAKQYWGSPFKALLSSRQLVEYIVLDIEMESSEMAVGGSKYALAYVQVARVSDFGKNDNIFTVKTHIGHLLNTGDYALGYDLYGANINDFEIDKYKGLDLPNVILVKKSYEEKRQKKRGKGRSWKLKSLNIEIDYTKGKMDEEKRTDDYEVFLRELEENPELRFNISLYRDNDYQPSEMTSTVGGDELPSIPIDELIAELAISDEDDHNSDSMAD
ncbi:60S ribosomal export protein NMD3-like [Phalaenopsis equestris]|uniref:60S ribosomal export protein NMD3-like n=1 Tax=Phalaenopsis equestris TaxID=78828 RepID=UPI0009E54655|nr:60S ribosomal export protein NMD3-like [Phalaenopsis equestris]